MDDPLRGRTWRLYLLRTSQGICLELLGLGGDCNDARAFFANAPYELLDAGGVIAAALAPSVHAVKLRSHAGRSTGVSITPDHGLLLACAQLVAGQPSCLGSDVLGYDGAGRQLFSVRL